MFNFHFDLNFDLSFNLIFRFNVEFNLTLILSWTQLLPKSQRGINTETAIWSKGLNSYPWLQNKQFNDKRLSVIWNKGLTSYPWLQNQKSFALKSGIRI